MADMFRLKVVTPDRIFFDDDASMVELSTTEGDIGVYREHIPMTAVVAPGILRIHQDQEVKKATLMAGFVEILKDRVTVMAEVAEWPEDIDVKRAQEAQARAERRLANRSAGIDIMRAELALKRALIRLEATAK